MTSSATATPSELIGTPSNIRAAHPSADAQRGEVTSPARAVSFYRGDVGAGEGEENLLGLFQDQSGTRDLVHYGTHDIDR